VFPAHIRHSAIVLAAGLTLIGTSWVGCTADKAPPWPAAGVASGNVLLVTLDTLRADRLNDRVMPRLSALARSGHRFRNTYTHASILTGLLPPAHGVRGNGAFRLGETHRTLAERLKSSGYRTGAFVGAFVLDERFGLARGFDRYDSVDDDRDFAADFAFAERAAPAVLSAASQWIREADSRPWFAWVHLFDAHAPHDASPAAGLGPYDDEVHLMDARLGAFLDQLSEDGRLSKTLVVVTADHGESLGEHGESTHGLFAYDATMRVPLVVSGPGIGIGDHAAPAALVDLVPTVLDAVGLPADPTLAGRSLRLLSEPASGRPIYIEAQEGWLAAGAVPVTAVVEGGLKFIELPVPELYDLATDPGEARNLYAESPDRARPLAAALRSILSAPAVSSPAPRDADADARLRSLGYVAGGARTAGGAFTAVDDPKNVLPLYERFLSILSGGGNDISGLSAIVEERPAFIAARMAASSLLIESGRAREAVAMLVDAAGAPDAAGALTERLGAAYLAAGQPAEALRVLTVAVAGPNASADAWNGLGVARAQTARPAEARAAFDEAARLAPGSARIRINAAMARLEAGDPEGAMATLTRLTADRPEALDAWRLLATLRHGRGDLAGAVDAWQRIVAADRRDFDSLFNLAITLRDLGRTDDARTAARRFTAAAPRPEYGREAALLAPLTR